MTAKPLMPSELPLPPEADQVLILMNPRAGPRAAGDRVARLAQSLQQRGLRPEVLTDLAAAADRANQQSRAGRLRALVGVGGDGTAAELVNRTLPDVPLTMLPAGNENLLAKYVGLDPSPEALCRTIANGVSVHLDAGLAAGRIFLLMASCGFDAEVVRRLHSTRTGHVDSISYLKPILGAIRSYQYPELRLYWDTSLPLPPGEGWGEGGLPTGEGLGEGSRASAVVRWLFAFNLPCYATGLRLAPQADGTDGWLDVCGFRQGSIWHGLRYLAAVLTGRHQALPDCLTGRVRRVRITSDAEVPYQLDGDPGGMLPVEIEILPKRLRLIVPQERTRGEANDK